MSKFELIAPYFEKWESDVQRAEGLLNSDDYCLEGLIVIVCYIGALGALRYQNTKDWKSYKDIISNYSGNSEIFDSIDLLLFYQFQRSRLVKEKIYEKLNNYDDILGVLEEAYGNEQAIKDGANRYVKKDDISKLIKEGNADWYDEENFLEFIQLFSNNQILYKYARCDAVHNADFPLLNPSHNPETGKITYEDNHQVDRALILSTLKNIVANLKEECLKGEVWPWEL